MGMSGTQAHLLTITARIHDVELRAESIEDAKLDLAVRRDEAWENYIKKLDATKIQIASGVNGLTKTYVDATFQSVCTYDSSRTQQYALRMSDSGKVIVSDDVYNMYKEGGFSNDKYAFAWAMLGLEENFSWNLNDGSYGGRQGMAVGVNTDRRGEQGEYNTATSLLMTDVEQMVFDNIVANNDNYGLSKLKEEYENATSTSEKRDAFNAFREKLYSNYGRDIYSYMILKKENPNNTNISDGDVEKAFENKDWGDVNREFNYYVRLFEKIQNSGGCVCISEIAKDGNTGNDWFNMVVSTGQVVIDMWSDTKRSWEETSVATSSSNNNLQRMPDETEQKKAEAEYEHDLTEINQKDKNFDKDLKKLETERNALKTEEESAKKIRDDNIERTFGIFS